eukprot:7988918-Pyramimonas_sp.AAC.1
MSKLRETARYPNGSPTDCLEAPRPTPKAPSTRPGVAPTPPRAIGPASFPPTGTPVMRRTETRSM